MITYKIHHVNGLFFELSGDENKNREYDVVFYDNDTKTNIYECKLKVGTWSRLERKYLSDISIIIRYEGRTIKQINFLDEIKGKRVFISFGSKALGDTLAWIPYCDEFAKKYECKVIVSTFKNFLFEKVYPNLEFVDRGTKVDKLIGMFEIGWYWEKNKEPINPILIPLQKSACNILHLPFKEIQPEIDPYFIKERPFEGKYVCISIHSTALLKYWYYWQELIDGLKERGYKVVEISKDKNIRGIDTGDLIGLEPFEDKSLENTMNTIYHCDFFVGLSSGLSWMSWALRKKVFMIANFTEPNHEFNINTTRIFDHTVCNSCWHNPLYRFNKGDWNWCPEHEDTPRQFECHKVITAEKVLNLIKEDQNWQ
jgi:autotransporter strand-loop-strand O-heptosyltransferase